MSPIIFVLLTAVVAEGQVSVTTYRNDLARSGGNPAETILTPASVNPAGFGKLASRPVDGQVYAQPLYVSLVNIPGKGIHNVVYVATEHDSVYAFDADSDTGANADPLWHVNFTDPSTGERTLNEADVLNCPSITPELGITGTPVIDPSTGTLYVVASTILNGQFFHRLHALDITTGAERPGSPVVIAASVPGVGDGFSQTTVPFHPYLYKNRAGLLLLNGVVYTAWTSHCDAGSYHGWLIGYDAADLRQMAIFNDSPNAFQASLWMGGAAPAADAEGNIYVISGNGPFDTESNGSDLGDSFIKLSSGAGLTIADYFTPFNQLALNRGDIDLGSSGALLLPDEAGSVAHPHLLAGAGKEGRIYLLDRDQMGSFNPADDSQIVQSIPKAIGPLYGGAAYFNQTLFFAAANDSLKAFAISDAHLMPLPSSQSSLAFGGLGAAPTVSSNGATNGIVWLVEPGYGGTLHAYDASNLANELYNSQMNPARDARWLVREILRADSGKRQGVHRNGQRPGGIWLAQRTASASAIRAGKCCDPSTGAGGAWFPHFDLWLQPCASYRFCRSPAMAPKPGRGNSFPSTASLARSCLSVRARSTRKYPLRWPTGPQLQCFRRHGCRRRQSPSPSCRLLRAFSRMGRTMPPQRIRADLPMARKIQRRSGRCYRCTLPDREP